MIELMFRVYIKPLKRYATGIDIIQYHKCCDVEGAGIWTVVTANDGIFEFDDIIVEQYTGLKDKNGNEIYEGDIVSEEFVYRDEKVKTIWQVRWCDDECAFELHYASGFEIDDCSLDADEEDYEVIGNIHENPELLEKQKNHENRS